MRTIQFLASGFMLLAALAILARLFATHYPAAASWATGGFVGFWLMITAANMWTGVSKAGYSVQEEPPIFLLLFGLPAIVSMVLRWKVL